MTNIAMSEPCHVNNVVQVLTLILQRDISRLWPAEGGEMFVSRIWLRVFFDHFHSISICVLDVKTQQT